MTILAVDGSAARLAHMKPLLERIFPQDTVVAESDPLVAGQFCFRQPVDVLYAALEMKRMDGLKLACFVRRASPGALTFLLVHPERCAQSELWADELDGQLTYPLDEAAMREALRQALQRRQRAAPDG